MKQHLPPDDAVRKLLPASRACPDARSAAAMSLILSVGTSVGNLTQMRWADLDFETSTLTVRVNGKTRNVKMTPYLCRQLRAIPRSSGTRVFGRSDPSKPRLGPLIQTLLNSSGLGAYKAVDFVLWSERQSPSTRLRIVTV